MWSLYLGVLISACIAKKHILWICYLASFSLIQATSDVCVMAHTMCPCCPFPCLSSLPCMFLCVITILRTRKCRCLTILSFLSLKDVFCCLCTLSSFLPIALKTLFHSLQKFLLELFFCSSLLWYLPVCLIDFKSIWHYTEPLKSLACFWVDTWKWIWWRWQKPTEIHFMADSSQLVQWGILVTIFTLVSCHKLKELLHKGWELCCNWFYLCAVILSLIVSLFLKLGTVHSLELCFWETTAAQNGMPHCWEWPFEIK